MTKFTHGLGLLMITALLLLAYPARPAAALLVNRYVATTGSDTGNDCLSSSSPCLTIQHAMDVASADERIKIAAGTYNPVHLTITKSLVFQGAGSSLTFLDGGNTGTVFSLSSGVTASIVDLTITHGNTGMGGSGGGIYSDATTNTVVLTRVRMVSNIADVDGGAIYLGGGTLESYYSEITSNHAVGETYSDGGGLFISGAGTIVMLNNTTISLNEASLYSGGIHYQADNSSSGYLQMFNVTITGNTAKYNAAGVNTNHGQTRIISSTIASNHSTGSGSGGYAQYATGPIATVFIRASIFANNDNSNCVVDGGSVWTSEGNNISSDATCGFSSAALHDRQSINPLLRPLADYGGVVPTMALQQGSPAIDGWTYNAYLCTHSYDARGKPRPYGPYCDIGAFEYPVEVLHFPLIRK